MSTAAPHKSEGFTFDSMYQMFWSFAPNRLLTSALQIGLFKHMSTGHHTAAEISHACRASQRGTRMLLDGLAALQIIVKKRTEYSLTPVAEQFLVKGKPDYIGDMMETDHMWQSWGHLTEAILSGHPVQTVEQQAQAEQFFPTLVRMLHVINRDPAKRMAQVLASMLPRKDAHVIDIAAGSGIWGISLAETMSRIKVTAQDYPVVLGTTREYVERHKLRSRYDFLPGNLNDVHYGTDQYDCAILGNIVHSEGEKSSRALFKKLYKALRPGGVIAILDMVPNDERTGPPPALIFALNMLLHTTDGDVFTMREYTSWLKDANFIRVEKADIGGMGEMITAFR